MLITISEIDRPGFVTVTDRVIVDTDTQVVQLDRGWDDGPITAGRLRECTTPGSDLWECQYEDGSDVPRGIRRGITNAAVYLAQSYMEQHGFSVSGSPR